MSVVDTNCLEPLVATNWLLDNPLTITLFETVNARGKELETSDLLKNNFFKKANDSEWNTVEKDWDIIVENSEKSGGISRLLKHFYI